MIEIKNKIKPIRRSLPYQGSKQAIAGDISAIIKEQFGQDKTVYDVFGGGAAVSKQLLNDGFDVVYDELDKNIYDAVMNLQYKKPCALYDSLILNREEFFNTLNKEDKNYIDIIKLLVNSFSNNKSNYIYSKADSEKKDKLINEIYEKYGTYKNYRLTDEFIKSDIKRLNNLEKLKRIVNFSDRIPIKKSYNNSYKYFSDIKNEILYLDPPYENSANTYQKEKFNSQEFYDWAFEMSKNNIVLISSYEITDERFESIYNFNRKNQYGNNKNLNNKKTEKLFAPKKIK